MRVLVDTNVIIDVLQQRMPWSDAGNRIFLAVANQMMSGCLTSKEIADIHFFSRKQFKGAENVDEQARTIVGKLMTLFEVLDTLGEDCKKALSIRNKDYEDAIMIATAEREHIDCIITRNPEHFNAAQVPVLSPEDFLAKHDLP